MARIFNSSVRSFLVILADLTLWMIHGRFLSGNESGGNETEGNTSQPRCSLSASSEGFGVHFAEDTT
jgi:hypothetical protein